MSADRVWSRLRGRILACLPDGEWPDDADAMLRARKGDDDA